MSRSRSLAVFRLDLASHARRPMLWVLVLLLALNAWALSIGQLVMGSGDTAVGGAKVWVTSEFSNGLVLSLVIFLQYSFFVAIAAGLAVVRDEESKVGELLHSTPLTAGEYVWGKFLAVLAAFAGVMALHLAMSVFFNHLFPDDRAAEFRGPFSLANYIVPFVVFGLPPIAFIAGTAFAVGERARRPVLVFFIPIALFLFCAEFLWGWAPTWLDPRINRLLMLLDPSGFRWLNETWMKVDRGVEFYNRARIGFDAPFLLSRLGFVAAGLGAVEWSRRRFAATSRRGGARGAFRRKKTAALAPTGSAAFPAPLAGLKMGTKVPGRLREILEVARVEFRELAFSPGLYLFVPLILLLVWAQLLEVGAFGAPLHMTPGFTAAHLMNTLTLFLCPLLLFYTVESLVRDRVTGIASISCASPARTGSILFGKVLANGFVGAAILSVSFIACSVRILAQGSMPFRIAPFAIVWGLLLVPTLLLWTSFATALFSVTGSRYATYALALGTLSVTGILQYAEKMSWVGNWTLWGAVHWSDMGPLEPDRTALVLNRLFALSLAALFVALAVRFFPRTTRDPVWTLRRLEPARLRRGLLSLSPFLLVPAVLGAVLGLRVHQGFEGGIVREWGKDYWRRNLATWKDAPLPGLTAVELHLELVPEESRFRTEGSYRLANHRDEPMAQLALTGSHRWRNVRWTLDGKAYDAENRSGLYVFTPPAPLAPGEEILVGFSFDGFLPDGISRNGAPQGEFILPSGAVLTDSTAVVPVVGFVGGIGVDEDNRYEPEVYPDDFYEGRTEPAFGSASAFTTRISVTAPAEYTVNSVGVLDAETVTGGKRTSVWRSDHPVRFFNVVAGKWAVRRGAGTAVFYHPSHAVNVPEMSEALDAARKHYGEWFRPYPWAELKLSEFPAHAVYAQGYPTNITFSEGLGFLTRSDPRAAVAFAVTAHESAHQWWGGIVTPGEGPGGNVVAEGLAHYSAILLLEEVRGPLCAMEFRERIEENYGETRQRDSERPLVRVDGSKEGDQTVTYDKGGWVFWMLHDRMGRDAMLAGLRDFVRRFENGPDFPVLQDVLAVLREHAPDAETFDAFARQWFHEVVVPEYRIVEARRAEADGTWEVRARIRNEGAGTMPIEVAAARGARMDDEGKPLEDYRDARRTLTLGAGEEGEVVIACDFEPDRVVVDPDVRVLQLRRNKAVRRF